ncbi:carbon storage regulator [Legionella saoudiensis]|uniref:carbon storage regulator n=1 Tax=Legionella saoudiensis TaxID=1750561 RepID=UPI00098ECA46|nr:carbon storage regulator [Legionella saoudiensis]
MLVLSRKVGESIMITDEICITILKNIDGKVDVGISAPKEMAVNRLEIYRQIKEKKRQERDQIKQIKKLNGLIRTLIFICKGKNGS